MAKTKINYADYSFSPWVGCSGDCPYCFARKIAKRFGRDFANLTPVSEATWKATMRLNAAWGKMPDGIIWPKSFPVKRVDVPRPRVLCGTMCDWLDENADIEIQKRLVDLFLTTPNLDWLMLTKRPDLLRRLIDYLPVDGLPKNVWFGITAENQEAFDERWWWLENKVPAAKRWVSVEPITGMVRMDGEMLPDWAVVGCMTGVKSEDDDMENEFISDFVNNCLAAGVPVWVKQMRVNGRVVSEMLEMPDWARFRQVPK
jgi:protein gp37